MIEAIQIAERVDVIIVMRSCGGKEIYPETGKSSEIKEFLDSRYDLLHYEEDGKKSAVSEVFRRAFFCKFSDGEKFMTLFP